MSIDSKIIQEIKRYNSINNYIFEQDAAAVDPLAAPADPTAGAAADPTLGATATPTPEVIDTATDTEVEKIGDDGASEESSEGEELDITDLVNSQKKVESKQEEYFDMMFKQIEDMQSKLNSMDQVFEKLNSMEEKIEKYRPKTPQEKLELRSLDSGPFHQKLSDFFQDKQDDMEKAGKNEYVLTSDEVEQIVPSDIKKSFDNYGVEPTQTSFKMG
jgi:TolA-binding protein